MCQGVTGKGATRRAATPATRPDGNVGRGSTEPAGSVSIGRPAGCGTDRPRCVPAVRWRRFHRARRVPDGTAGNAGCATASVTGRPRVTGRPTGGVTVRRCDVRGSTPSIASVTGRPADCGSGLDAGRYDAGELAQMLGCSPDAVREAWASRVLTFRSLPVLRELGCGWTRAAFDRVACRLGLLIDWENVRTSGPRIVRVHNQN